MPHVVFVLLVLLLCAAPARAQNIEASYQKLAVPLFTKYCVQCHGDVKPKGDLSLTKFASSKDLIKAPDVLDSLLTNLRNGDMPPEGKPKPTRQELDGVVKWLEERLVEVHLQGKRDPGRVTLRRLNRSEYNNTIRDLTGVKFRPADDFPADDVGHGFDNIGDVLTLPPPLLEKYLNAAQLIADEAVLPTKGYRENRSWETYEFQPREPEAFLDKVTNNRRLLYTSGEIHLPHDFPKDGEYHIRVRAYRKGDLKEPLKMELRLDGVTMHTFDVIVGDKDRANKQQHTYKGRVRDGKQLIGIRLVNPPEPESVKPIKERSGLVIARLEIDGPFGIPPPPHRILINKPEKDVSPTEAARKNLSRFAEHAFRRPLKEDEVNRLVAFFETAAKRGETFEQAHRLPLLSILVSPHFLFRVELDNSPEALRELNDFELASRLSYFLWSTMPDDTLFELARQGKLKDPAKFAEQAARMLRDPKAQALVQDFACQWLQLRNLRQVTPDTKRFPAFDEPLREAMQRETELFFWEMLQNNHPLSAFLDADFTFVNDRLARHYGLADVKGKDFRKVTLKGTQRRGLLTQGSILTLTSNATRTSPVKRGKWVLETILGTPPPPPEPDVPELKEGEELKGTLRQRMEQHRANPNCAACHSRMDPIGFGFENFDAIGAWRTKDGNFPVDPGGTLPSGQSFTTPLELVAILKQRDDDFRRCLAEKLLTYALGRGVGSSDRAYVADITKATREGGDTLQALIRAIVTSEPFRFRRTVTGGS
jgi:hypothetical protein